MICSSATWRPTALPAWLACLPATRFFSVNGVKLYHCNALEDYAENHPNETLTLSCLRQGRPLEICAKPEVPATGGKASLGILTWEDKWTLRHPGAIEQVNASVTAMVETFGALFARHSDIKPQHLGGAVKIMEVYSRLFNAEQGWRMALWFSVLMNVNLAVLNLLPIPVLDGGHILLAVVEGVRRRPISARLLGAVQTTCAVLLIGFMLYIAFYDVQDLPWKRGKDKSPEHQVFSEVFRKELTCAAAVPHSYGGVAPPARWSWVNRGGAASSSAAIIRSSSSPC